MAELVPEGELVAFNAGPDGGVYLVAARKSLDYRHGSAAGANFPAIAPAETQDYHVVATRNGKVVLDVLITDVALNIHHVQPIGEDILLLCARCSEREDDAGWLNGRIYNRQGEFLRAVCLGDAIQDCQATAASAIWTSYFDEAIYGRLPEEISGSSGLVCWDRMGSKRYEYAPPDGFGPIDDCYALNVATDDDAWCYYYSDFPLVHLHKYEVVATHIVPIEGSNAFAVEGRHVLFADGYDRGPGIFHLFALDPGKPAKPLARLAAHDEDGAPIGATMLAGRGNSMFMATADYLYRLDVSTALSCL